MAKDKERNVNPAQAQRKLEKQKALKKGKAEAAARRNEKLARRNPERIQRQINDLKAVEESGQSLRPRDKQVLEELERDLRAVHKAREALGDKAPHFGRQPQYQNRDNAVLGKRRRDEQRWKEESESSDTDESVRNIPMPRDTPPPIPRRHRRRDDEGESGQRQAHPLPSKPEAVHQPKTVYESAPVIRDLRQEAVSKFVPAAVRRQQDAVKGRGKLVEPEEMDRLEKAGYLQSSNALGQASEEAEQDVDEVLKQIEAETRRPPQHNVEIEEVPDEDL
ncbi:WW domain binding protein 11-domain-containing protein [Talaromyces proteolyticus]|uniref:WW domain binding protein 11-domain-containing protein n=1 Tax=Talaromyces proteolyticus TaxID=1131652 RepID=A0AAD4L2V8_9EURO|nr:WW domain binding protein 11-domain-containing protein [Talaromyces proteolyticus]KAH8705606.1 WW domain binding protein 11-domain-containing protein [Talaromyces proteolyticus]